MYLNKKFVTDTNKKILTQGQNLKKQRKVKDVYKMIIFPGQEYNRNAAKVCQDIISKFQVHIILADLISHNTISFQYHLPLATPVYK